jgi:hypothetical protein
MRNRICLHCVFVWTFFICVQMNRFPKESLGGSTLWPTLSALDGNFRLWGMNPKTNSHSPVYNDIFFISFGLCRPIHLAGLHHGVPSSKEVVHQISGQDKGRSGVVIRCDVLILLTIICSPPWLFARTSWPCESTASTYRQRMRMKSLRRPAQYITRTSPPRTPWLIHFPVSTLTNFKILVFAHLLLQPHPKEAAAGSATSLNTYIFTPYPPINVVNFWSRVDLLLSID